MLLFYEKYKLMEDCLDLTAMYEVTATLTASSRSSSDIATVPRALEPGGSTLGCPSMISMRIAAFGSVVQDRLD